MFNSKPSALSSSLVNPNQATGGVLLETRDSVMCEAEEFPPN